MTPRANFIPIFRRDPLGSIDTLSPIVFSSSSALDDGLGFKVLFESENAVVDIVAIHGLNGHREHTWTHKTSGVMWLRDLLPLTMRQCRIATFGYDADTHRFSSQSHSVQTLFDHAMSFLEQLSRLRHDDQKRPVIFIAYDLGGIIIKHALVQANSCGPKHRPQLRNIKVSTHAIFFFGTPHFGIKNLDAALWLINICSIFIKTKTDIMQHLKLESEQLLMLGQSFLPISHDFDISFFCETYPTVMFGSSNVIVPPSSAAIQGAVNMDIVQLPTDHIDLVKYEGPADSTYLRVLDYLQEACQTAPASVAANWEKEATRSDVIKPEDIFQIPIQLPLTRKTRFAGRQEEMERMRSLIIRQDFENRVIVVLFGLGGMGKTELALEFAMQNQRQFSATFWINAASDENIDASFLSIAQQLLEHEIERNSDKDYRSIANTLHLHGLVDDSGHLIAEKAATSKQEIMRAVHAWLSNVDNCKWLLIIDNLDNVDLIHSRGILPGCLQGTVIITSRHQDSKELGIPIEIDKMDEASACQLLVKRIGYAYEELPQDEQEHIKKITKELGCLPMAIELAAAYIESGRVKISDYLAKYRANFKQLMSHRGSGSRIFSDCIYTTWEMSFNQLRKANEDAADLLSIMAFLSNNVSISLLDQANLNMNSSVDDAIAELKSHTLAKRDIKQIRIHPVVHEWSREHLPDDLKVKYALRATYVLARAIKVQGERTISSWTIETQVMQDVVAYFKYAWGKTNILHNHILPVIDECTVIAQVLYLHGFYKEAGHIYKDVADMQQLTLGLSVPSTLTTLHELALAYNKQGKYDDAEKLLKQLLNLRAMILGNEHLDTLATSHSLAAVYNKQGRYNEAEVIYKEILAIRTRLLDAEHLDTLSTSHELASVYNKQGKYDEAEKLFEKVQFIREQMLGFKHPETLKAAHSLASVYSKQGRYDEAQALYQKVLVEEHKVLGAEHPHTLTTLHDLALLYNRQGRYADAEKLYDRVLAANRRTLGPAHPDTLATRHSLAGVYNRQRRYAEAEAAYKDVLAARARALRADHPDTLATQHNLAAVYHRQRRPREAKELYKTVLAARERELGRAHPSALSTAHGLGAAYQSLGRPREAEKYFKFVFETRCKVLRKDHPDTLLIAEHLEALYRGQGRFDEAGAVKLALAGEVEAEAGPTG